MISDKLFTFTDKSAYGSYHYPYGAFILGFFNLETLSATFGYTNACRESHHFLICNRNNPQYQKQGYDKMMGEDFRFLAMKVNDVPHFTDRLNDMLERIETKLGLQEKTVIYKTQSSSHIVIHLSPFWAENQTRQSLVTLFLRCGAVYHTIGDDLGASLKKYNLTIGLQGIINHFLDGNVHPKILWCNGFYNTYANTKPEKYSEYFAKTPFTQ